MLRSELCHMVVEVSSFAIRLAFSAVGSSEYLLISLIAVTIQGNYQHIPSSSQLITMWGTPDFGENRPDVCFNIHPFLLWNAAHFGTLSWGPQLSSCVLNLCTCVYLPFPWASSGFLQHGSLNDSVYKYPTTYV